MTVGGVLSEAWELYRRFFVRFVTVAAVVFVVLALASALAESARGHGTGTALLWALVSLAITLVGSFWVQAALVLAVQDVRDGRIDTTVEELYGRTRPYLPSLIGAGLLAGLGIAFGLVLFIVPGLFLLTRWSLITPVIALEHKKAGESFGRSNELVKGQSWTVLGVIVSSVILAAIAQIILGVAFSPLPRFVGSWIGALIADSLTVPFLALAWTCMYFRLARGDVGLT